MNAKKLSVSLSVLVLGLTSCGSNGITRKEAYTKLDAIVAATPAKQTKLTSVNNTMKDVTDSSGVTTKAGTLATYVFDAEANYAHVTIGAAKTVKLTSGEDTTELKLGSGDELFAYADGTSYVFGAKTKDGSDDLEGSDKGVKVTVTNDSILGYAAASSIMKGFAQTQIDAFVKCGREHWHNGAGGLSAYLKRQDTLDQKKEDVKVGDQTIQAGATDKGSHIVLQDEKYSSTGEGNLVLDFDALYPDGGEAKLHEPLKFEFNNNILTHWYNAKASSYAGNEWTMNYGTASNDKCTYTEITDATKGTLLAASVPLAIAALVAVDQPTSADVLYTAKWGK